MKVQARAKINLALDVVERMDNGYHSLDMIMVPISIYDEIEIEKNDFDVVECEGMKLPENNTVSKMIQVLKDTYHLDLVSKYLSRSTFQLRQVLVAEVRMQLLYVRRF